MSKKPRKRSEHGFTLLELLVNVGILGILASMAISTYRTYRLRGYEATAIVFMRNWPAAQEMYLQTYGHYADADEQLETLGLLKVPKKVPYDFSVDSSSAATERWWGRANPTKGGLRYFYIDYRGNLLSSMSGPPMP